MMDVNGTYEQRMQQYQSLLREAEERRFARDMGMPNQPDLGPLRPVAGFWHCLSQILSPEASSDNAFIHRTRYGG
jgi:hypothetical protein